MLNKTLQILLIGLAGALPASLWAETVYINDRFMVGMHQEKSVDSVISKLLPSGTPLDMIKKDDPLSQVREPDGTIGWVDNQYLVATEPGRAQLLAAENRIDELEAALQNATVGQPAGAAPRLVTTPEQNALLQENEELKQLLKSERLRVGELQAQTAELKNRLSGSAKPSALLELEKIQQENRQLLKKLQEQGAAIDAGKPAFAWSDVSLSKMLGTYDWKKILVTIFASLLVGIAIGAYLLDVINRRRHGGFRI